MIIIKEKHVSSYETRVALKYALLNDIQIMHVSMHDNVSIPDTGTPLGSVEFVRDVMRRMQINEPRNMSYPDELKPFLKRNIELNGGLVIGKFVKPVITKEYNGFVLNEIGDYDEHDFEQFQTLLLSTSDYWVSDKIKDIHAEYRFYIHNKEIAGYARYDDGITEVSGEICVHVVKEMIEKYDSAPIAYSLDVAITSDNEVILIEANDCWALGLYKGMNENQYMKMVFDRWNQIRLTSKSNSVINVFWK